MVGFSVLAIAKFYRESGFRRGPMEPPGQGINGWEILWSLIGLCVNVVFFPNSSRFNHYQKQEKMHMKIETSIIKERAKLLT